MSWSETNNWSLIKWSPRLSINLDTTDEDKGLFSFNIYPGQQTGEGRMCVSSGMINWTDTSDSSSSSHWSPILTSHTPDSFLQTYQRNILETYYKSLFREDNRSCRKNFQRKYPVVVFSSWPVSSSSQTKWSRSNRIGTNDTIITGHR